MLLLKITLPGRRSTAAPFQYPERGPVSAPSGTDGLFFWAWDSDAVSLLRMLPPRDGTWLVADVPDTAVAISRRVKHLFRAGLPVRKEYLYHRFPRSGFRCCPEVTAPNAEIVYAGTWSGALECIASERCCDDLMPGCTCAECLFCGPAYTGSPEARRAAIHTGARVFVNPQVAAFMEARCCS